LVEVVAQLIDVPPQLPEHLHDLAVDCGPEAIIGSGCIVAAGRFSGTIRFTGCRCRSASGAGATRVVGTLKPVPFVGLIPVSPLLGTPFAFPLLLIAALGGWAITLGTVRAAGTGIVPLQLGLGPVDSILGRRGMRQLEAQRKTEAHPTAQQHTEGQGAREATRGGCRAGLRASMIAMNRHHVESPGRG